MKPHRTRVGGSAMVLALLLIAVMGLLAAGWLTVMSARSGMVEQTVTACQRRIALENSKSLAQEFMLERVMAASSGTAFTYSLTPASWGRIAIPAWGSAPLVSVEKAAGVNHFNPGNGDGYTLDLSATVSDGLTGFTRRYQVKSRSPLLAGHLLTSQTPTLTPTATVSIGAISVSGAAFVWQPGLSMTLTPTSYSVPDGAASVTFTNSSGATLVPDNIAAPRQISNPRASGLLYTGQFDAIANASAAANSSTAKATSGGLTVNGSVASSENGVVCDGSGNVTITLNTRGLGNVYIPGEISSLTLEGQASASNATADDLPAILIVVNQPGSSSRDLSNVTLSGHNNRRVNLAIRKAASTASLGVQLTTASAAWRLVLEAENTPISITASGSTVIQGGIRSDRTVALSGNLRLSLESDGKYLERLATRTAWVESFAQ